MAGGKGGMVCVEKYDGIQALLNGTAGRRVNGCNVTEKNGSFASGDGGYTDNLSCFGG
jgi:hypothetical protein